METALLKSKSKPDLRLLLNLAKKIGVESKILSADDMEEICIARAIQKGRTGEFVDQTEFLRKLKKRTA